MVICSRFEKDKFYFISREDSLIFPAIALFSQLLSGQTEQPPKVPVDRSAWSKKILFIS
jgi:hypothetical protein